jgi:O-antigen ligase
VFAPKQLAVLLALAAASLLLAHARAWRWPRLDWRLWAPLLALVLWADTTLLWAVDADLGAEEALRFSAAIVGAAILIAGARTIDDAGGARIGRFLVIGTALGAVFLAAEIATRGAILEAGRAALGRGDHFIFSVAFNRATAVIAVLAWPLALIFLRRRRPLRAAATIGFGLFAIALLDKNASAIALTLGALAFTAAWFAGRLVAGVLAVLFVLSTLVAPLVPLRVLEPIAVARAHPDISFSEFHRLIIWRFTAERIAERPLQGWGMNSSRVIPGGKDMVETAIPERAPRGGGDNPVEKLPLHPHSAPLQLWLELGLPGAILGAAFAGLLTWRLRARTLDRATRATSIGSIVAAGTVFAMSFSVWQSWWLSALALVAAFTIAAARTPARA